MEMTGSKTRKYTTASTATVTESLVKIFDVRRRIRQISMGIFEIYPRNFHVPPEVEHQMSLFVGRLWYRHRRMVLL
jgi:hypothetical protein